MFLQNYIFDSLEKKYHIGQLTKNLKYHPCTIFGAATWRWILKRIHIKTKYVTRSFLFIGQPILFRTWRKTWHFDNCHLLSQSRCETRSLYGTFVELSIFPSLTHTFQDPPSSSSTHFLSTKSHCSQYSKYSNMYPGSTAVSTHFLCIESPS